MKQNICIFPCPQYANEHLSGNLAMVPNLIQNIYTDIVDDDL